MNTITGLGIMPAYKIRVSVQVQPQVLNRTSFLPLFSFEISHYLIFLQRFFYALEMINTCWCISHVLIELFARADWLFRK